MNKDLITNDDKFGIGFEFEFISSIPIFPIEEQCELTRLGILNDESFTIAFNLTSEQIKLVSSLVSYSSWNINPKRRFTSDVNDFYCLQKDKVRIDWGKIIILLNLKPLYGWFWKSRRTNSFVNKTKEIQKLISLAKTPKEIDTLSKNLNLYYVKTNHNFDVYKNYDPDSIGRIDNTEIHLAELLSTKIGQTIKSSVIQKNFIVKM
jgi:hypothetical protein